MRDRVIKGIIFDMDGTIFDTERLYYKCWKKVAEESGYEIPDELLDRMRGGSLDVGEAIFNDWFGGSRYYVNEREKRQRYLVEEVEKNGVPFKEGLEQMLGYLKREGYRTALATSTHAGMVRYYFNISGIGSCFDTVMTGDMVEHGKPDPDIFIKAAECLGLKPEECAVVEDSKNGIRAGFAAGAKVIHIPDMEKITDAEEKMLAVKLKSLAEIPAWLEKENM